MIMEPLMATAAEATDMVRVGRSAVYRLIGARQRESIKIGRSQREHRSTSRCVDACDAPGYIRGLAEVVELVDALRSGRSGLTPVGVRVPPSALYSSN